MYLGFYLNPETYYGDNGRKITGEIPRHITKCEHCESINTMHSEAPEDDFYCSECGKLLSIEFFYLVKIETNLGFYFVDPQYITGERSDLDEITTRYVTKAGFWDHQQAVKIADDIKTRLTSNSVTITEKDKSINR